MEKTSIAETLTPISGTGKRKLRRRRKRTFSGILDPVARDANNPTKLRAQQRAHELGKSLSQVYSEAGVNHGYLSQLPKTGWRQDRLEEIAKALDWSVDELMKGARLGPAATPAQNNGDLMELAIEIAVDLLHTIRSDPTAPKVGRLSRLILESLQRHVASGEKLPSSRSLLIWGRLLMDALKTSSISSK